jgi:small subunit ribosomal protein S2
MTNLEKKELAEIGVQFGGPIRWRNPQMRPYIYKKVNKHNILDLKKIATSCQEVGNYIQLLIKKKKTILFLSTKKQAREAVKEAAVKCGMPYIVNK